MFSPFFNSYKSRRKNLLDASVVLIQALIRSPEQRLKEIAELDKKVNRGDLVYRYKGKSPDGKFDKYDNALDLINKIQIGEIKLSDAKIDQTVFKSHLGEIKKGNNKKGQKSKKRSM